MSRPESVSNPLSPLLCLVGLEATGQRQGLVDRGYERLDVRRKDSATDRSLARVVYLVFGQTPDSDSSSCMQYIERLSLRELRILVFSHVFHVLAVAVACRRRHCDPIRPVNCKLTWRTGIHR